MATNIEQSICEAIDIIVNKAVAEANYDKTIQCTIVSCVDASTGKYRVRYQDSTFTAYSIDLDTTYSDGTSVYVLVPGNDMNEDKKILGSTKNLGADYISALESDEYYEINGNNIVTASGSYTLCSYAGTQAIVLYSKDYSESQNLITVDKTAAQEYIKNSGSIICGGYIRTDLPAEQQYQGNYGIIFALDFMDNTGNEVVTRYYTIDVDNMTGNPYRLIYSTRQYGVFDIDAENFIEINYISIFCYNFPHSLPEEECIDDIFITNLELYGANLLSSDDLNNYSLTFITTKGTYFTKDSLDSDTLPIEAQLRVKGKVVDTETRGTPFYWGYEHAGVNLQSQYYCKYLGQGWKCINNYNIIDAATADQEPVVEWIPSNCLLNVKKTDVVAKEMVYKCAVIYDDSVITKTITIKNLGSEYDITIESDSGTQFYFDIGSPTLTCLVNNVSNRNYSYAWSMIDNNGVYTFLADTSEENEEYDDVKAEYDALLAAIKNGSALQSASQARLEELEEQIATLDKTMRVDKNIIYHLAINMIVSFSTFKCTVYNGEVYLGTGSIAITNSLTAEGSYSLLINNGTYLYKYNESGVSPTSSAAGTPIETRALTFTIYDNLGNAIDDEVARHCTIEWTVPTVNTLLQIPDGYTPTSTADNTAVYSNIMSLSYTIASRYDITKTNNDISLYVNYKGMALYAKTNLTFIKEGENGTNGTDYTCKLVPNAAATIPPKYVILSQTGNSTDYTCNFTPAGGVSSGLYLRVEVYHNETRVYSGTASGISDEGKQINIVWSILQNTYSYNYQDASCLTINSSSGKITYSGYNNRYSDSGVLPPANIVKVAVTSEDVTNYVTCPIITVRNTSNYECELKEGSGFLHAIYTSDGQSPSYDNVNPFEATVTRYINNYWEDISTNTNSNYVLNYKWYCLGGTYEVTSYNSNGKAVWSWVNSSNLEERYWIGDLERNQYAAKPVDEYTNECVTNALECIVTHSGTEVARMHIPVHLMLNRYGLAALNGWDGNSIEINEEGGFILAPQVGAGVKETDNSFTGIVIGATKESGMQSADVGLIGYSHGARSIFLDAYTGKSVFGVTGGAQIIIDPSGGTAKIRSGNYSTIEGKGLLIDFSTPYIQFGSGNFVVDEDGYITAKGGGNIAGFYINDDSLWTNSTDQDDDCTFRISAFKGANGADGRFKRTIGVYDVENLVLASQQTFGVTSDGALYAAQGNIGGWIITDTKMYNDMETRKNRYSKTAVVQSPTTGDPWVFACGGKSHSDYSTCPFRVDRDGNLTASSATVTGTIYAEAGYIGGEDGWVIEAGAIYNGTNSMKSETNGTYIGALDGIRQYYEGSYLTITNAQLKNQSAPNKTTGNTRYTAVNAGSVEQGFNGVEYGSFRISSWSTLTNTYGVTIHGENACKYISFGFYDSSTDSYSAAYFISNTSSISSFRHNFRDTTLFLGKVQVGRGAVDENGYKIGEEDEDVSYPTVLYGTLTVGYEKNKSGYNTVLHGPLTVGDPNTHKSTTLNGSLEVATGTELNGSLTVAKTTTLNSALNVAGAASFNDTVTIQSTIQEARNYLFDIGVPTVVRADAQVGTDKNPHTFTVRGDTIFGDPSNTYATRAYGTVRIDISDDNTGDPALRVHGKVYIADGVTQICNGLTVADGVSITGGLDATGGVSLGATTFSNAVTISGSHSLTVGGQTSVGSLDVTGSATMQNTLTVGGTIYCPSITFQDSSKTYGKLTGLSYEGNETGLVTSIMYVENRMDVCGSYYDYQLCVKGAAYASDGWAGTSDVTLKSNVEPLSAKTDTFLDKLEPISFTFKDDDAGKTHFGVTYQNVCEALEAEGIDPNTSGVVGTATDEDGVETGTLFYDELIAPLIYEVKTLKAEMQDLRSELANLKAATN